MRKKLSLAIKCKKLCVFVNLSQSEEIFILILNPN